MKFGMLGCSHHTAPVEIREKVAFADDQYDFALQRFREAYPQLECALLNTCNRVELYVASAEDTPLPTQQELMSFVEGFHGLDPESMLPHFQYHQGNAAIVHLFSVASSIDSIVVGESQIAAQVHEAYDRSLQAGYIGPTMHAVFQHANQVAKRVANETEINKRRTSVPSVAVSEVASEFFERFDDKQIVVIGSGDMGVDTLQYLQSAGASKVHVVNRTEERAQHVAQRFQVQSAPWDRLDPLLADADLIVSTTGASQPIMTESRFRTIMAQRSKGTLLILDLAVPRDFEPSIGKLPSVYLYSVDDLQMVCDRNKSLRQQQLPKAQRIIREEAERLLGDWHHRSSSSTIKALREHAEQIRQSELLRLKGRQAMQGVTPELEAEISQSFDRLVNKLLHSPMQSLREVSQHSDQRESLISALRRLFKIG